ncbi:MAG: efflux RND transporter periplasmic adaptor subunit [Terriglobales bacterium]
MFQLVQRTGIFLLLLLLLVIAGCDTKADPKASAAANAGPPAMPVKVRRADPQAVGQYTEYIATLKSRNSAVLKPEVEGQITRIMVKSGDQVQVGDPLLEIDPRKQEATVNSQEATHRSKIAALQWNQTELERRKKLYAAGVISKADLDQQQTAYDAAKADVDSLAASVREQRVQLRYYIVKAPAAGVIGDIPVRVGDRVTVATELTTLDKTGELEAYISVPSEKAGSVKRGTPVNIIDDSGNAISKAQITFVSPRVDPATQLLLVKALISNGDHRFRNDQLVHVRVVYSNEKRILVPVTAVIRLSGQPFVYVAETANGKTVAKQRPVKLGEIVGNDYTVLDGVKPGEELIITGTQMIGDGAPVTPQS